LGPQKGKQQAKEGSSRPTTPINATSARGVDDSLKAPVISSSPLLPESPLEPPPKETEKPSEKPFDVSMRFVIMVDTDEVSSTAEMVDLNDIFHLTFRDYEKLAKDFASDYTLRKNLPRELKECRPLLVAQYGA
jgi:hypothetical protein